MKINGASQGDEEGWKTVRRKRYVRSGNSRSLLNKNGLCFWIEAKGFSFTKGFGSKSGKTQIIEAKGDRFSTLWINQKGLSWFRNGLLAEISKSWSKSQVWQMSDLDEWLTVTRGRNNNAGNKCEGWNQVISIINQLFPVSVVSSGKTHSSSSPVTVPNPPSVWVNPNSLKGEIESLSIEKVNWNQMTYSQVGLRFGVFHFHYGIRRLLNPWVLNVEV
ncbi:hypothetical protein MKX03_018324 [Papaver bracteatum]|nr:hypothetical protein MKX03_018324 [Papaver bracteatum]